MAFPPQLQQLLLTFLLLLPLSNCFKLNLYRCEKTSTVQNLLSNVNTVIRLLSAQTPATGFSAQSSGAGSQPVNGLSWCNAKLSRADCATCLSKATAIARKNCPNSLAARSWYGDFCYLRYDPDGFVGQADTRLVNVVYSKEIVSQPEKQKTFVFGVRLLLNQMKLDRPKNGQKFVTGKRWFYEENSTIFGVAQCTKDIGADDCSLCLGTQLPAFDQYCRYHRSCEILFGSCMMGYGVKKGFDTSS